MERLRSIRIAGALLVAVLVWAICLRIAVLPLASGRALSGDPASYVNIAQNLLTGDGLMRDHGPLRDGLRAYYPPLYPLLLAAIGLVAPLTPPTFTVFHLLIDIATAIAIVWLASAMGLSRGIGFVSAAVYLLWPTNILMAPVPQKEGLSTLLVVCALGFLMKRETVAFGAASGLLALTQPALVTLPALAALLVNWHKWDRGWFRFVSLSACVAALVILPWWIRSYILFDRFVLLTTSSGMNFWVGTMGNGVEYVPEVQKFTVLPEPDRSAAAFADAFAYVAAHPIEYLQHTIGKVAAIFEGDRWGTKPLHWMKPLKPGSLLLRDVPYVLSLALLGLAAFGTIITKNRNLKLILFACLTQLFVFQIWFQFSERHRYFMVPILMLIAVNGVRQFAVMAAARWGGDGA